MENIKVQSVASIINNVFSDDNNNISQNELISLIIGFLIEQLDKGIFPSKQFSIYLESKAMEVTKSDPNARPGKYDALLETAQMINTIRMLPRRDVEFEKILLMVFHEEYLKSSRSHFVERDTSKRNHVNELLSSYSFLENTMVLPMKEDKSRKSGLGRRKDLPK